MTPEHKAAEVLDLLLDQLQHHTPDGSARLADIDPGTVEVVRELHLLAAATPIRDDLVRELERRLAGQVESLVAARLSEPAGTPRDVPRHVAVGRTKKSTGEWRGALDSHVPSPQTAVEAAGGVPPRGSPPVALRSEDAPRWPMKILIVDQHPDAIAALKRALNSLSDLEVVGDAGFGPVASTWAYTLEPAIIIVSIEEPVTRSLSTIQALTRGNPAWTVVGLVSQFDREVFRRAVLAGVRDLMLRNSSASDLHDSLIQARRADAVRSMASARGSRHVALQSAHAPSWRMQILIVDDDRELIDLLAFALKRAGLEPIAAYDAASAMRQYEERHPDLVVLDINLGNSNGLNVLKELRRHDQLPVIMLTALDSEDDKVRGLELGANDYLTKPFSHRELIARIRAQLRRSVQEWQPTSENSETRLIVGPLTLDLAEHSVTKAGQAVSLTVTEFRLLHCLMSNAGVVVPTATLLTRVWGYPDAGGSDVVRVTVHRLRRKLEDDPAKPRLLHTIPGVGVLLKAD
jgi:two-component system, OmpR family, response regulator VicR